MVGAVLGDKLVEDALLADCGCVRDGLTATVIAR